MKRASSYFKRLLKYSVESGRLSWRAHLLRFEAPSYVCFLICSLPYVKTTPCLNYFDFDFIFQWPVGVPQLLHPSRRLSTIRYMSNPDRRTGRPGYVPKRLRDEGTHWVATGKRLGRPDLKKLNEDKAHLEEVSLMLLELMVTIALPAPPPAFGAPISSGQASLRRFLCSFRKLVSF